MIYILGSNPSLEDSTPEEDANEEENVLEDDSGNENSDNDDSFFNYQPELYFDDEI